MGNVVILVTPLTIHGVPTESNLACERCNLDLHRCYGCGDWLYHDTETCPLYDQEVRRGGR